MSLSFDIFNTAANVKYYKTKSHRVYLLGLQCIKFIYEIKFRGFHAFIIKKIALKNKNQPVQVVLLKTTPNF